MNVLVFKTNMVCAGCIQTVASVLRPFSLAWTVDLDDCDNVLRVETASVSIQAIIQAMHEAGFACEELTRTALSVSLPSA